MGWKQNNPSAGTRRWLAPVAFFLATLSPGLLTATAVAASAFGASPKTRLHDQFLPGARRVYRLSYTNSSKSDFRALFAGRAGSGPTSGSAAGLTHAFQTKVEGEWVATLLDGRDHQVRIVYHLRQSTVRLWTDGQEALVPANTVLKELSRDMVVVADRQGRVRSVQFDPAMGELSQNYARALLSLTQWVLPDRAAPEPDQWMAEEEDPNGRYIAHYRVEKNRHGDSSAVQTIRKRKVRYLVTRHRRQAVDQEVHPTVLPTGTLVARFDRQRATLLSLNGSETASIVIRGKTVGRSATGLRLQYLGQEKVGAIELAALRETAAEQARRTVARSLSATESREASEAAIERKELGDATQESLLAELAKVEADAVGRSGAPGPGPHYAPPAPPALYTPLYLKLKALIYLHPDCSRRLGTLLAGSNPNGVTAPLLTGALSAVGHPQAQAALVEAIRDGSRDAAGLTREIAALASVGNPTPLAEATVRWESVHAPTRSLRVMAELALGTMARNLADGAPARATRIIDEVVRKLRASPSPEEARLSLMALGNAGSVRALHMIARFMAHPSPLLRASAAAALRWIDAPQVDAWLTRCLQSDPDATVRQEAAAALGFREPTAGTIVAQQRAFRTDRVEAVRLAILSNLGRAQGAFPELRELIQRAAARDPSPNVRKVAAALVARFPRRSGRRQATAKPVCRRTSGLWNASTICSGGIPACIKSSAMPPSVPSCWIQTLSPRRSTWRMAPCTRSFRFHPTYMSS